MLQKKYIVIISYIVLLLFLLFDLSNSFRQYYVGDLDGDIAESVLPYPNIQKTFDDPTGIKTIVNNDKHLGTNRFFSHYFLHKTFREVPLLLQKFCSPIDSVYYTSAIAKLFMHISILFLLSIIISGRINIFSLKFVATAAFLTPFFQGNGRLLAREMGIIDVTSYSFFYAAPLIFLLLYYIPLLLEFLHDRKITMNWILVILWAIFAIIACFSGPLIPPTILIINTILCIYFFLKNWKQNGNKNIVKTLKSIPKRIYLFVIPISFLALYSIFLGTYINAYEDIRPSLKELYVILPQGIFQKIFASISYSITGLLTMSCT